MAKLVLIRHGQSEWNLANKFTGWIDVDLSEKGVEQAKDAGKALKEHGIQFDYAYTSVLKRAIKTLNVTMVLYKALTRRLLLKSTVTNKFTFGVGHTMFYLHC